MPQSGSAVVATPAGVWSDKLDSKVRFYQTTELGALIVGTEKSLYAIDGESGEVLWRRKNVRFDETDVAPITGTDLLLLSFENSGKTRVEAVDLFTGQALWLSDKIKGSVMQIAVDLESDLAAVVFAHDAKGRARQGFKKKPTVYLLNLTSGEQIWKHELESDIEMMPALWFEDEDEETVYTLDNYRPPLFLDGRLYLFYEGVTSLDARTGKERIRERFRVNEDGLALTEADPVIDENNIYFSGRGRVRAISRSTGRTVWEAKDLGLTPEMILTEGMLYVRTGGQFTRLKDGEIVARGPYGVSAIDPRDGRLVWRYRGADKGLTNLALLDASTVLVADRDDLVAIDTSTGKPRRQTKHEVDRAAFVLINEPKQAVVGGRDEIAAFASAGDGREVWRVRHEAPGRGVLRTVAAIAARSASLYFRFGGVATTAFRGVQIARGVSTLRWSGLATRVIAPNLTDFAAGAARDHVTSQFRAYGIVARVSTAQRAARLARPRRITPSVSPSIVSDANVEERLMDRLDPSHQLDRLSRFLWRRTQLAVLRGQYMYFYTDLKNPGGRGLAGVNLNTGRTERRISLDNPDHRLTTDEVINQLYLAKDERLFAFRLDN
jgi:outer membrane protein assembly factor BamB